MSQPDVSIILPTRNRLPLLSRALASCISSELQIEIIVIDGASTDGTREWLAGQPGIVVIREAEPLGWVRAMNTGLGVATGRFIGWLNDDAVYLPYAIENAINVLTLPANADVAMLALYHNSRLHGTPYATLMRDGDEYQIWHVRGIPYANFGVFPAWTREKVGMFDERFQFYAADPDYSIRVWQAGYRLALAPGSCVSHLEVRDETREASQDAWAKDNGRLCAKYGWTLGSF